MKIFFKKDCANNRERPRGPSAGNRQTVASPDKGILKDKKKWAIKTRRGKEETRASEASLSGAHTVRSLPTKGEAAGAWGRERGAGEAQGMFRAPKLLCPML